MVIIIIIVIVIVIIITKIVFFKKNDSNWSRIHAIWPYLLSGILGKLRKSRLILIDVFRANG